MKRPPKMKASPEDYRRLFEGEGSETLSHSGYWMACSRLDSNSPAPRDEGESSSPRKIEDLKALGSLAEIFALKAKVKRQLVGSYVLSLRTNPPHRALIDGRTEEFASPDEKFDALVAEWHRLRQSGSSVAPLVNDAYGQIVAMGWQAVPMLLREVAHQSGHWFTALKWITGANVVTKELRGNIRAIRNAWLRWGIENGHLPDDGKGRVDEGKPSEIAGSRL